MPSKNKKCALILIGGYGTRLRPLTFTHPKPLVPFINKPILFHQIDNLYKHNVLKIILATSSRDQKTESFILESYKHIQDLELLFSYENKPLGTAGPLYLARDLLNFPCFVLNADVTCDFPFTEMYDFHIRKGVYATILTTKVENTSKYGVIVGTKNDDELVERFVEKPKSYVGNRINAGIYVIDREVVDLVRGPDVEVSIEKEIFPILAYEKKLGVCDLNGYWMDIGQPKDFLEGMRLFIENGLKGLDQNTIDSNYIFNETVSYDNKKYIETKISATKDNLELESSINNQDSEISNIKDTLVHKKHFNSNEIKEETQLSSNKKIKTTKESKNVDEVNNFEDTKSNNQENKPFVNNNAKLSKKESIKGLKIDFCKSKSKKSKSQINSKNSVVEDVLKSIKEMRSRKIENKFISTETKKDSLNSIDSDIKMFIKDTNSDSSILYFNNKPSLNVKSIPNITSKTYKPTNIDFYALHTPLHSTFSGNKIYNSVIHKSVIIGKNCEIGNNVVIGKNVIIGNYVKLEDCCIFENSIIDDAAFIRKSIVGWHCHVKKWVRLDQYTVLGNEVIVQEGAVLKECTVLPNKTILSDDVMKVII